MNTANIQTTPPFATERKDRARLQNRPIFVFSTPPTPNGDLHLGHLSGPYLGADVYVRYLKSIGLEAYHLTGSDDYQSYVVSRARQKQTSPQAIATHYAAEMKATLDMMDIHLDQYTISSANPSYAKGLQIFFSRLIAGGLSQIRSPALFDRKTNSYLYEADVCGNCPTCDIVTSGNICEECGEPNTCVDLITPQSKLSEFPPMCDNIERYAIRLEDFKNTIYMHHKKGKISPRLQQLADKILNRKDYFIALTHPAVWGIPPIESVTEQQVIWVWAEMAYGFLHSIGELGQRLGYNWHSNQPQADWKFVHFFGYDNSFYHTILFPILYQLAFPEWQCDIDYHTNEFYLLDGRKFSTSRNHAIWGKDILTPDNVDAVRYYLAWTRGEHKRTNFTLANFYQCVDEILLDQWQYWLNDLGNRICKDFSGRAPEARSWTPAQIAYFSSLENYLATITTFYSTNGFSLNRVVDELNSLVKSALNFSAAYSCIRNNISLRDEYQTAIALELATAQLLAKIVAPLMPRFASRLSRSLGMEETNNWPSSVELLSAGKHIDLAHQVFFASKKHD